MSATRYLVKYGPETLDWSDTLSDARAKRRYRIELGAPRRIYIVRTTDNRRFDR